MAFHNVSNGITVLIDTLDDCGEVIGDSTETYKSVFENIAEIFSGDLEALGLDLFRIVYNANDITTLIHAM